MSDSPRTSSAALPDLHELQNVPPQVVRVDNVEGQCPPKNAGLILLHHLVLVLLLLHGVIICLLSPGALRLARVQLCAEPRERRDDGVPAVSTADEAEVRLDARVAGGPAALLKNRAAVEGTLSDRSDSLGEGDGGEGGAAVEGPLVPINSLVNVSHSRQHKNVRDA